MGRSFILAAIIALLPATLSADILAAINTPLNGTSSTVDFFDPGSLNLGSSFNTPVVLEGIALGGNSDIYVSSGNNVYHYDLNGNLLGSGIIGKDDVVELSYYNGQLWAASNNASSSTVTQLDPSTLATLGSFDATNLGPLTGISASQYGIYLTGDNGFELTDSSGNIVSTASTDFVFGPVSAVPGSVYTSVATDGGYVLYAVTPDFSYAAGVTYQYDEPGIAGIDVNSFFYTNGNTVNYLNDVDTAYSYSGSETDSFGNLSYSSTAPEPATLGLMGFAAVALFFLWRRSPDLRASTTSR